MEGAKSWESWWDEEQEHLSFTGFRGRLIECILAMRFFLYQYGIIYHLNIVQTSNNLSISVRIKPFHEILNAVMFVLFPQHMICLLIFLGGVFVTRYMDFRGWSYWQ